MIEARNISMHYGPVKALKNASFTVNKGEIVGLVGPNGAGKSTTMKILTTYLFPSEGTATVCGHDIKENAIDVRRHIGYLPEVLPLYKDMEVRTYLEFIGRARGLSPRKLKTRIDWVTEKCGLVPMFRKLICELSKGYKQRTGIAQALIHDPDVVILDEPTSGLDPHQILEVRSLINELAEEKTVLLSTHILQEVEASAQRIIVINRGDIVGDGTMEELRNKVQDFDRTTISFADGGKEALETIKKIKGIESVHEVSPSGKNSSFKLTSKKGSNVAQELGKLAKEHQWHLIELADKPFSLEETFLALTEKKSSTEDIHDSGNTTETEEK